MTATSPATVRTAGTALLLVLSGNMLLDAIEVSTAVVAMPDVGAGLGVGPGALHWVMTGFALGFGGLVLAGRGLVRRLGARPVYLAAMLVFAAASLVGALSGDFGTLVATRVVKGACAALTAPTGIAIIAATFDAGPPRNRAVAVYSTVGACGFAAGLVLSGVLTGLAGWRATFLAPAPVALLLVVAAWWLVPRDRGPSGPTAPWWRSLPTDRGPLLRSMAGAVALNGSFWGYLYALTVYLQGPAGWSPLRVAAVLLPSSLLLTVAAPVSHRLIARFGTGRLIAAGAVAAPVGYLVHLLLVPVHPAAVMAPTLLVGAGFALGFSALHVQAVSTATPEQQGPTGGLYQTSVQLGGALVLAVAASLPLTAAGETPVAAWAFVTGVGALGALVALVGGRLPTPAKDMT